MSISHWISWNRFNYFLIHHWKITSFSLWTVSIFVFFSRTTDWIVHKVALWFVNTALFIIFNNLTRHEIRIPVGKSLTERTNKQIRSKKNRTESSHKRQTPIQPYSKTQRREFFFLDVSVKSECIFRQGHDSNRYELRQIISNDLNISRTKKQILIKLFENLRLFSPDRWFLSMKKPVNLQLTWIEERWDDQEYFPSRAKLPKMFDQRLKSSKNNEWEKSMIDFIVHLLVDNFDKVDWPSMKNLR